MKFHHLKPAPGAKTRRRRVGRGIAAGQGKTSGRGTKGQKAHTQIRAGFEGGQTPLHRRLPKFSGFRNPFRVPYHVVNVGVLDKSFDAGAEVTADVLRDKGLIRKAGWFLSAILCMGPLRTAELMERGHSTKSILMEALSPISTSLLKGLRFI